MIQSQDDLCWVNGDEQYDELILSQEVTGKRDLLHFNPIRAKALSLEQLQVNPVQPIECSFAACGFAAGCSASQHFVFDCDAQLRFKTSQINIRALQILQV